MKFIVPTVLEKSFTCPSCHVIAQQQWRSLNENGQHVPPDYGIYHFGTCHHCTKQTVWLEDALLYPFSVNAPPANIEMPLEVKKIYDEAAIVCTSSPRSSSALLRLAVQHLCKELGESGENINNDIASLVKKGLPVIVQQSLDVVRITGNNAVHPGVIDVDSEETALSMFNLINVIVEYMIAMPKRVSGLYSNLPSSTIVAIEKRDNQ